MGDKFTVFGKDAFKNCSELEYINIPDSLTQIADGAFYGCDKLPEASHG